MSPPTPSSCRTPEEELVERTPGKQRRSDSRDHGNRNCGGGGFGGVGKNYVGGDHQHHRGGDNGREGERGASGAGVALGAAGGSTLVAATGQWPQLWRSKMRAEERGERT